MKLSLMTVFLPRENIFFIEEWLKYHIVLGVDHFFLYNNAGSLWLDCGNSLEVTKQNKRGEKIYELLDHKNDKDIQYELDELLEPYKKAGYVTQIAWQPKDEHGNITYDWHLAYYDYVKRYSAAYDWTGFTDMDEFVLPLKFESIPEFLTQTVANKYNIVQLPQKPFSNRFDEKGIPVKEVLKITCCSELVTSTFGGKNIIQTGVLRIPENKEKCNIHSPWVRNAKCIYFNSPEAIRFNHYKFNQWEVNWARQNVDPKFCLDTKDDLILRYYSRMKQLLF